MLAMDQSPITVFPNPLFSRVNRRLLQLQTSVFIIYVLPFISVTLCTAWNDCFSNSFWSDGGRLIYRITLILFIPSFQASKTKRQGVAWLYGISPAGAHSTSQTKLKCHSYISHSNYCFSFTKKTIFLSSVAIGGYVCHQLKDCHCMKKREQAGPWARVFEQWK